MEVYLVLLFLMQVSLNGQDRSEWKAHMVNGRELRDWKKGPNLYDYLNQLGREGWELVATWSESVSLREYCFKRPRPQ